MSNAIDEKEVHHLHALDAVLPMHPDVELTIGSKVFTEITFVSQRSYFGSEGEISADQLFVVACACLDYPNKMVYTTDGMRSHSSLCHLFNLDSTMEQVYLNDKIFGFVTASGHFFNREMSAYFMRKFHPGLLKDTTKNGWFNSEMINWKAVQDKIKTMP